VRLWDTGKVKARGVGEMMARAGVVSVATSSAMVVVVVGWIQ
jgi:hypothetical protein